MNYKEDNIKRTTPKSTKIKTMKISEDKILKIFVRGKTLHHTQKKKGGGIAVHFPSEIIQAIGH